MKKDVLITSAMIAVAIVGAGYLYGDKIANKIGIDLHKPKVQVEESIDKKEDNKNISKTAETKSEEKIRQSPEIDTFMSRGVKFKNSFSYTNKQILQKLFGQTLEYYAKENGDIVVEGVFQLAAEKQPMMRYVFKKDNPMYYPIKYIEIPSQNKTMGTTDAEKYWLDMQKKAAYALDHSDNY